MKHVGVIQFPGSNCDQDVFDALKSCGQSATWLWHKDLIDEGAKLDGIVIPGGFSYGDYLRAGALAAKSPVMKSVQERARKGTPILGICNGFQVLCETGLLPGALLRNEKQRFIDSWVELKVVRSGRYWHKSRAQGEVFELPIAHGQGRFFAPPDELKALQDKDQVWLQYESNPNGSECDIAGVMNEQGNVYGLMPHPERASEEWLGGTSGRSFLEL